MDPLVLPSPNTSDHQYNVNNIVTKANEYSFSPN